MKVKNFKKIIEAMDDYDDIYVKELQWVANGT